MLYKGFYLVEIENNKVKSYDGSHSRRHGVVKALELYRRLGFKKPLNSYFLVHLKKDVEVESVSVGEFAGHNDGCVKLTNLIKSEVLQLEEIITKKVKLNESALKVLEPIIRKYS